MYFCHNELSFRPIHMKPTPKCSLFSSLSSDMVTNIALAKVCTLPNGLYVCTYVCYQIFSKTTGPNSVKFSGTICHHPRTNHLDFGSDQAKGQGQGHEGLNNYWRKLHEIFRDDMSSSKDHSIRFWE